MGKFVASAVEIHTTALETATMEEARAVAQVKAIGQHPNSLLNEDWDDDDGHPPNENLDEVEMVELAPLLADELPITGPWSFNNSLVNAVWLAYSQHYPLVLGPDDVWAVILQGFAQHVNANAEALRSKFVNHSGQKEIEVIGERWDIVPRSTTNNWKGVVSDFANQIEQVTNGDFARELTAPFSCTGEVQTMVFRVALLDSMQSYFTYLCSLRCGIPWVQLLGTVEDWKELRQRTHSLSKFELGWWVQALDPVLDCFVRTAQACDGQAVDEAESTRLQRFWSKVCHREVLGSGPTYMSGWINLLFPYTTDGESRQETFLNCKEDIKRLVNLNEDVTRLVHKSRRPANDVLLTQIDKFPSGISAAPFTLKIMNVGVPMQLVAGFLGVVQDQQTLAVRPRMGWCAVRVKNDQRRSKVPEKTPSQAKSQPQTKPRRKPPSCEIS